MPPSLMQACAAICIVSACDVHHDHQKLCNLNETLQMHPGCLALRKAQQLHVCDRDNTFWRSAIERRPTPQLCSKPGKSSPCSELVIEQAFS